jgi:hypothetical protein
MSPKTRILLIVAVMMVACSAASAAPDGAYPAVPAVYQGQQIVVNLQPGLGKPVKGIFLESGPEGIRLQGKGGEQTTIPWESVRKITPKRQWFGFWVGMATGAALAGIAVLSSEGDVGARWSTAVVGAGAGAGAAVSGLDGAAGESIYEAPQPESATSAPQPRAPIAQGYGLRD